MSLEQIKESDIATAISKNDLDDACGYLQGIAGITHGDVAGVVFSGFDWSGANADARETKLREWLQTEAAYQ